MRSQDSRRRKRWECLIFGYSFLCRSFRCSCFTRQSSCLRPFCHATVIQRPRILQPSSLEEDDEWLVGNVYEDLKNLEHAITLSNAEQDLEHQERLETLDYFAAQRRPLYRDIRNNLLLPLLGSLLLTFFFKSTSQAARWLTRGLLVCADLHFWFFYVAAPALFCLATKIWQHPNGSTHQNTPPAELKNLGPEYMRFVTTAEWQDPETSCTDYVRCLMEQWMSATGAMAFAAATPLLLLGRSVLLPLFLPILTKLATLASLRQFPKLWFQLNRKGQPRPLTWSVYGAQLLVGPALLAPWSLVPDISRLMINSSWSSILIIYSLLSCVIATMCLFPRQISGDQPLHLPRSNYLFLFAALTVALVPRYSSSVIAFFETITRAATTACYSNNGPELVLALMKHVLSLVAVMVASIGPLVHLVAFRRIVRVSKCNSVSLAVGTTEKFQQIIGESSDDDNSNHDGSVPEQQVMWRWRTVWREPRRVRVVVRQWRETFWYWFFFAGSVQDQLRRELSFQSNKGDHQRRRPRAKSEVYQQGLTVLQRVARDRARNPDAPMPDRTQWKQQAMDRVARKHQMDYDQGTFQDPLGIAVYKTLGIGLGFNFDHMSKLKEGERPSTRRLQARAAKSALQRVQDLYNAENARIELETIADPVERERRAQEMRQEAMQEVQYIANCLSNLIPTDKCLVIPENARVEQFSINEFPIPRPERDYSSLSSYSTTKLDLKSC